MTGNGYRRWSGARRGAFRVGICAALISGAGLGSARGDTLHTLAGPLQNVEIVEAKWDQVVYTIGGARQTVEGVKVVALERSSQRIVSARELIAAGKFAEAEKAVETALSVGAPGERAEAAYLKGKLYLAWAGRDPSRLPAAIAALDEYLKNHRAAKEFFVPYAIYDLGNAFLVDGKPKPAADQFKSLTEFGGATGIWGQRSKVGQGWALLKEQGEKGAVPADKLFAEVTSDRSAPPVVRQEAAIGHAVANNLQGLYDGTIAALNRDFFESGDSPYNEFYAEACNVMGDSYKAKKEFLDAELWYLRTTCFFEHYPASYRKAAAGLVEVYKALGNAARAQEWEAKSKG